MARRRHRVDLSGGRLEHASDDQAFSTGNKVHFFAFATQLVEYRCNIRVNNCLYGCLK